MGVPAAVERPPKCRFGWPLPDVRQSSSCEGLLSIFVPPFSAGGLRFDRTPVRFRVGSRPRVLRQQVAGVAAVALPGDRQEAARRAPYAWVSIDARHQDRIRRTSAPRIVSRLGTGQARPPHCTIRHTRYGQDGAASDSGGWRRDFSALHRGRCYAYRRVRPTCRRRPCTRNRGLRLAVDRPHGLRRRIHRRIRRRGAALSVPDDRGSRYAAQLG